MTQDQYVLAEMIVGGIALVCWAAVLIGRLLLLSLPEDDIPAPNGVTRLPESKMEQT